MAAIENNEVMQEMKQNLAQKIHDDVLATGGTMRAAYNLVMSMNPKKVYVNFIIELTAVSTTNALKASDFATSL